MTIEELQKNANDAVQALVDRLKTEKAEEAPIITIPPPVPFKAERIDADASARMGYHGEGRDLILVMPGHEFAIERQFDFRCKLHDLRIEPALARYFDVVSLKVGRDEQFWDRVPMPASAFTARWKGGTIRGGWAAIPPHLTTVLKVKNTGRKPHYFKAVYALETVEPEGR